MSTNIVFLLYILLPLRISQIFWTQKFKNSIASLNLEHNDTGRETYNPHQYKNAMNFQNKKKRTTRREGKLLQTFLEKHNPKRIMEIGPGSGFFTQQIFEHESVTKYVSLEVNKSFSDYLKKVTKKYKIERQFIQCDFKSLDLSSFDTDTIIAIECFHHLHDRQEFLNAALSEMPNLRRVFFYDPAHYLPRILRLLKKLPRYILSGKAKNPSSWSTHHFLTIGEFLPLKRNFTSVEIQFEPQFGPRLETTARILMKLERALGLKDTFPISKFLMSSISGQIIKNI